MNVKIVKNCKDTKVSTIVMHRWGDNRYPYSSHGSVVWDTHIYTPQADTVDQVLGLYELDLVLVPSFQNRQSAPVIIGEFAFSNLKYANTLNRSP